VERRRQRQMCIRDRVSSRRKISPEITGLVHRNWEVYPKFFTNPTVFFRL
jgi:hypothetical protein